MKEERQRMNNQYFLSELQNLRNDILAIIDPIVELKNGEVYKKRLSEAVKDSWERINDIQQKQEQQAQILKKIDNRTFVLEEFERMLTDYRNLKMRIKKYIKPLVAIIIKVISFCIFLYLVLKGSFAIVDILNTLLKIV